MNAVGECRSRSGNTLTPAQEFTCGGSFRRLKMLHLERTEGEMRKEMDVDTEKQKGISGARDSAAKAECCPEGESYERLLQVVEPYWPDLLRQGGICHKGDRSGTPTYVLKFRQRLSGTRDGRQKTVYVGKRKELADCLMKEIWRRRDQAGTKIPSLEYQATRSLEHERSDFMAMLTSDPHAAAGDSCSADIQRVLALEQRLRKEGQHDTRIIS